MYYSLRTQGHGREYHKDYNAALEEQRCKLRDGRNMGFAEFGIRDGIPAIFFHGAPGSRYDGVCYHEAAKELGVRLICPDRPGHGYSSPKAGRTLSGYAQDISDLAGYLKLDKYHVFGQSGGGPYVVACAYASPENELLNATIVAGTGHPDVLTRNIAGSYTVVALGLAARFPRLIRTLNDWWYPPSFWASDDKIKRTIGRMYKRLPPKDRALMEKPETWPTVLATVKAAFAQGSGGTFSDSAIYYGPWDFDLKDVKRKVMLIFAEGDSRAPVAFGRHYKQSLPHAELIELCDATHFGMGQYLHDILAKAVGQETGQVSVRPFELGVVWSIPALQRIQPGRLNEDVEARLPHSSS